MTKKAEDDIVERLVIGDIRKCPLDDRSCDLRPEDPCPVCGDLGTFDILNGPSKCVEVSSRLLRNEAAAEITRLRAREAELVEDAEKWRAFYGSARFKMIGSAGFDHSAYPEVSINAESDYGWLHFGLEVWDRHDAPDDTQAIHGRNLLDCYVEHLRRARALTAQQEGTQDENSN